MSRKAAKQGGAGAAAGAEGAGGAAGGAPSLGDHPRARHHIRLAKGWGGLAGFAVAAWLSWRAGLPLFYVGLRALIGGVAACLVAWSAAVHVWRHLAVAELRALHRRHASDAAAPPTHAEPAGS